MMNINTSTNEFPPVEVPVMGGLETQKPMPEIVPSNPEQKSITVTAPIAILKDSPEVVAPVTDVPKITVVRPVIGFDFVSGSNKPEEVAAYEKANGLPVVA